MSGEDRNYDKQDKERKLATNSYGYQLLGLVFEKIHKPGLSRLFLFLYLTH